MMAAHHSAAIHGRLNERRELDRVLHQALGGRSGVLVVRGEPGVGKSTLLDYCSAEATGFTVVPIHGVESEMDLPYAGLHQLCAPMMDRLESVPAPQQLALNVAFGLVEGDPPDRFMVSLAALTLLSEAATTLPILCLIDDAQWLDTASAQALGFVARRLMADPVAMVFAIRHPAEDRELDGLPELRLDGLPDADARALLASVMPGRIEAGVVRRILTETRGNPLAIVELPRRLNATQMPGAWRLGTGSATGSRLEQGFVMRLNNLPEDARLLTLIAAAEPADDPVLMWRAAKRLGVPTEAAETVEEAELLTITERVRFRHPLIRSAAYRSATLQDRRAAHLALAHAVDADADPDRRAWHLAAAAPGPDELVAQQLADSASRAQARGGLSAAAAFLRRSVALTLDPVRRSERALQAAQASLHAGQFDVALQSLAAVGLPADDMQRARVELLRAQIVNASGAAGDAPGLLLHAARHLQLLDPRLARETYLDAWGAAMFAGDLAAVPGGSLAEVSRAALDAPPVKGQTRAADLLLDALAELVTSGLEAAAGDLRHAVAAFRTEGFAVEKGLQWGVLASSAAAELWDFDGWEHVITEQMRRAREAAALAPLCIALNGTGIVVAWSGDLAAASGVLVQADALIEATRTRIAPYGAMLFQALRGNESEALRRINATLDLSATRGEGLAVQWALWTTSMLFNGLGRYEDALLAAQQASGQSELYIASWARVELIEAASRTGQSELAADALESLRHSARVSDSDWAGGVAARSEALLSTGDTAEHFYREAIERLSRTKLRPELARAHLVYGEWLRRAQRRIDARDQLSTAHALFTAMGAEGFAERTRRELTSTGLVVDRRAGEVRVRLTPQEEHIARLACDGRTNVQIGSELYLSPRTVEWHLKKVFAKLDITSRRELPGALPLTTDHSPTMVRVPSPRQTARP